MRRIMAVSCLVLGLMAGHSRAHQERLAGADWVLAEAAGKQAPYLRFDAGRVAGLGGCNRFGGRYESTGDSLSFSTLIATRMACQPEVMSAEHAFFDMLDKVKAMKLDGDRLDLLDGAGKALGSFVRRVAD